MSRRIAHRPRYHTFRHLPQSLPRTRKDFLSNRWLYRPRITPYQKRPLGQGILLLPWGFHLLYNVVGH